MTEPNNIIKKKLDEANEFKADVKSSSERFKNLASDLSRKEISFNFIDKISRKVYTNENHLMKVEFAQYAMLVVLLYVYNPLSINTKYPAFSKLLVLVVAFIYVILFFFIKTKVEGNEDIKIRGDQSFKGAEDVDLIKPSEKNIIFQFISVLIAFFIFMLAIKGFVWLLINTKLLNVFNHLMGIVTLIGIGGIIYLVMKKTINKAKNATGKSFLKLFLKIVLYLPCLLADFAEYIKYEFSLTTKPVWILCGIEAGFVALWLVVPYLFDKIMSTGSTKLLREPVNLNEEITIGNFPKGTNRNDSEIPIDKLYSNMVNAKAKRDIEQKESESLDNSPETERNFPDPEMPKNKYLAWLYTKIKNFTWLKVNFTKHPLYTDYLSDRNAYTYSISGWFYLNPQPPNTSESYSTYTNILNYGKKVCIEYNGKLNSLRVMASAPLTKSTQKSTNSVDTNNTLIEVFETKDIIYQKWNNIVVNYDNGTMDVFYNGVLVGTQSGVMPYMSFDTIVAGSAGGIMGGICNVNYYRNILPEKTIKLNYKTLRIKQFPYI